LTTWIQHSSTRMGFKADPCATRYHRS